MTPCIYLAVWLFLPSEWADDTVSETELRSGWMAFVSVAVGLWGGLGIGYITEYYTSYAYRPT